MPKLHTRQSIKKTTYLGLTELEEQDFYLFNDQSLGDNDTLIKFNETWFTVDDMCETLVGDLDNGETYDKYVPLGIASGYLFNLETGKGAMYQYD